MIESPIELQFWDAWKRSIHFEYHELIPQYPIGKYRVDFAHLNTMTVIELDGHATHSSPDAIAYDRKRERSIEALGWNVIRVGGKEIFLDADAIADEIGNILKHKPLVKPLKSPKKFDTRHSAGAWNGFALGDYVTYGDYGHGKIISLSFRGEGPLGLGLPGGRKRHAYVKFYSGALSGICKYINIETPTMLRLTMPEDMISL